MKKSEIYKLAQVVVIKADDISTYGKLEILRELIDKEDVARFVEEQEQKNEAV